MRTSKRSEIEYSRLVSNNRYIADEFADLYLRFQSDPRSLGRRFKHDDPNVEHWVYQTPRISRRPGIRIYFTIAGLVVTIEAVGLA